LVAAALLLFAIAGILYAFSVSNSHGTTKPIILYVNQGNGVVNESNFETMVDFAQAHGFNTMFFQIYREGDLLFNSQQLQTFVNQSHAKSMKIFFALYITNSSQALPTSIYNLREDGISLDMSTVDIGSQEAYLTSLKGAYHGETAVTTTDMQSPLKPDALILETYTSDTKQFIQHGVVASVGVFATTSLQDYNSQFQYALQNSNGVMVFDYAGLLKSGY
jgi:hypothetical protein